MKIKCLMCGELYEKGFFKRFFNCYKEGEGARFVWFIDICPKCEQYIDAKRQRKQLVKEKKTIEKREEKRKRFIKKRDEFIMNNQREDRK